VWLNLPERHAFFNVGRDEAWGLCWGTGVWESCTITLGSVAVKL